MRKQPETNEKFNFGMPLEPGVAGMAEQEKFLKYGTDIAFYNQNV